MTEMANLPSLRVVHPALHVVQWDGRHATANGVAAAVGVVVDEIGADVTHANYEARLSRESPALTLHVAREDDGSEWRAVLERGDWLALWVLEGRLVAVDVYSEADGNDRFVRMAPIIVLRPTLGQPT